LGQHRLLADDEDTVRPRIVRRRLEQRLQPRIGGGGGERPKLAEAELQPFFRRDPIAALQRGQRNRGAGDRGVPVDRIAVFPDDGLGQEARELRHGTSDLVEDGRCGADRRRARMKNRIGRVGRGA